MRAEELLETLTDDELKHRANGCFIQAENTNLNLHAGPEEKQRLLTEATFYLNALIRRSDDRVSRRDFRMEVGVMVLIGLEILLSVIGLWAGYQQGKILEKQTTALVHMDASTAATSDSLKTLAEDQIKSIDRLNQMNDTLRDSLARSGTMASATRKQLQILEQEQANRLAEQSKKPKLELYIGTTPLKVESFNAVNPPTYPIREQTETSVALELSLRNLGNATAHHPTLRVVIDANDVNLIGQGTTHLERLDLGEAGASSAVYLTNIDFIRPRVNVPVNLTVNFAKGHAPFNLTFNIDADEIDSGTPLGAIKVSARNPLN
jgi:hypothetical protein